MSVFEFIHQESHKLVIWFLGPWISDMMTLSDTLRETARTYLPWVAVSPVLGGICFQFDGIFTGAIIALGAIGVSFTLQIMRFANFAHSEFLTWGAYLTLLIAGFVGAGVPTAGLTFGWQLLLAAALGALGDEHGPVVVEVAGGAVRRAVVRVGGADRGRAGLAPADPARGAAALDADDKHGREQQQRDDVERIGHAQPKADVGQRDAFFLSAAPYNQRVARIQHSVGKIKHHFFHEPQLEYFVLV